MIAKLFFVDVFCDGLFSGERAAVAILRGWGQEVYLQALAEEMALPLMVYVLPEQGTFIARYFSPSRELDNAGYGPLAAAHIIYSAGLAPPRLPLALQGRDGERKISFHESGSLQLTLPPQAADGAPDESLRLNDALGLPPAEIYFAVPAGPTHFVAALKNPNSLKSIVSSQAYAAVSAIAPGKRLALSAPLADGMSPGYAIRFFSPAGEQPARLFDIDIHTILAPFWSSKLSLGTMSVHHQGRRSALLEAETGPDGAVKISGRVSTIFRADPVVSELTSDSPMDMFF